MTKYEIAKRLGVSPQAVSKWYNGTSLPRPVHLLKLSKLVGKDVELLLKELLKKRK